MKALLLTLVVGIVVASAATIGASVDKTRIPHRGTKVLQYLTFHDLCLLATIRQRPRHEKDNFVRIIHEQAEYCSNLEYVRK